jgi:hypothetical protein
MSHSHSSRLRRPRAAVGKCCLAVCLLGTFAFAQDILLALAEVPGMPALPRAQARLLRGEWTLAAQLADAGLSSDAINAPLRAAKVRALAALKDFSAAETELALLRASHNLSAIALAAVAISIERGDAADKKDAALGPLMGRPAEEWRPLLPVIAHQRTDRIKTSLNGRSTGLVTLNPLMIGLPCWPSWPPWPGPSLSPCGAPSWSACSGTRTPRTSCFPSWFALAAHAVGR